MFSPGAGQDHDLYGALIEPLANAGFISVMVETSRTGQDENLTPAKRASILACTLRWLASEWADRDHLNCDLVLAGHSRGGGAAYLTASNLANIPWDDINPAGISFNLEALISIAPAATQNDDFVGDPVPFLGFLGATDEDPIGQLPLQYDRVIPDEVVVADSADLPPKFMLLPYDVPHNAWGGGVTILGALPRTLTPQAYRAKAEAIWLAHAPLFLQWSVYGQQAGIARARLTGEDVPASLNDPSWWDHIQPAYDELGNTPVMPRAHTVDTRAGTGGARVVIDDFEGPVAFDTSGFDGLFGTGAPLGLVVDNGWQGATNHRSNALFVEWGSDPQAPGPRGGPLEWMIGQDISSFEFLSLRIGQILRGTFDPGIMGACEELTPSPEFPQLPDLSDAVNVEVTLSDGATSSTQPLGPVIQQETRTMVLFGGKSTIVRCVAVNYLQTLRLPLSGFSGVDLTNATTLRLTFDRADELAAVLIDTIELTTE